MQPAFHSWGLDVGSLSLGTEYRGRLFVDSDRVDVRFRFVGAITWRGHWRV
jgi:hypothetical protein